MSINQNIKTPPLPKKKERVLVTHKTLMILYVLFLNSKKTHTRGNTLLPEKTLNDAMAPAMTSDQVKTNTLSCFNLREIYIKKKN